MYVNACSKECGFMISLFYIYPLHMGKRRKIRGNKLFCRLFRPIC